MEKLLETAQVKSIKAMDATESADIEFLLSGLDQELLANKEAIELVRSFRKQIILVVATECAERVYWAAVEECAKIANSFNCGLCGMDGQVATAIRSDMKAEGPC